MIYYHTLPVLRGYFRPETLSEALSYLSQYGSRSRILAGGTDLLVMMRSRKIKPRYILDIKAIQGIADIKMKNNFLHIGAGVTLREVEQSELVQQKCPLLSEAVSQMASLQIRNMGTVAGNICRASPSADTLTPLLVMGARVEISCAQRKRTVTLENFLTGPGETALESYEMVTAVQIPELPENASAAFLRLTRVAADLAKVSASVLLIQQDNVCMEARIALGGVASTAFRSYQAEKFMVGKHLDEKVIEAAADLAAAESRPISDVRSSLEYRKEACRTLVSRAIKTCLTGSPLVGGK
jgi:aerobic carbon-monoxide dehydrogenase medium subunit